MGVSSGGTDRVERLCLAALIRSRTLARASKLARVVAGAGACDGVGARDLDVDGAPLSVVCACVRGLVGDAVERAHVGGDLGVEASHVFEAVNLVQTPARSVGECLHAQARGGVD